MKVSLMFAGPPRLVRTGTSSPWPLPRHEPKSWFRCLQVSWLMLWTRSIRAASRSRRCVHHLGKSRVVVQYNLVTASTLPSVGVFASQRQLSSCQRWKNVRILPPHSLAWSRVDRGTAGRPPSLAQSSVSSLASRRSPTVGLHLAACRSMSSDYRLSP